MQTFFIRHSTRMDLTRATWDLLWNAKKIGIHFGEKRFLLGDTVNESISPMDYVGAARMAVGMFVKLSRDGGYVLAKYAGLGSMIGKVLPGTQIKLEAAVRRSRNSAAVIKTLQLSQTKILSPREAARLLVGQPRQRTITTWPSAGSMVRDRIEGGKTLESLQDLEPVFQEVLCAEFLRLPTKKTGLPQLAHLTMPVGRTMEDLDVWGIDANGRPIIAQVTFGPSAQRPAKVANLKKYAEQGTTLIYFCGDENESKRDGIHFFPMKKAYDIFISQASGRQWLKEISG